MNMLRSRILRPGLNLRTRRSFQWTPAALYANGDAGAWYDPGDITTLYQTDDTSTPVTAAGQTVGYMADLSGNGNHVTQISAAARPLYQISAAGRGYLEFDGVDDVLTGTADVNDLLNVIGGTDDYLFGTSIAYRTLPALRNAMGDAANIWMIYGIATPVIGVIHFDTGSKSITAPYTAGEVQPLAGWHNGTALKTKIAGAQPADKACDRLAATATTLAIGQRVGTSFSELDFHGLTMLNRASVTEEELNRTYDYYAALPA